jgi:APA family basic amino acid/polyamine antiporter
MEDGRAVVGDRHDGYGLPTATFAVVSSMVGAGVLTTSGYALLDVPSHQLLLGLWAFGGLIALCGALTLAELSTALPRSGGEYVILLEAYGPRAAFLSGWVSLLLGFAAPIAAVASASATYLLAPLAIESRLAANALATAAILGFALVHSAGPGPTARVQGVVTLAMLVLLTTFVAAGLCSPHARSVNLLDRPPIGRSLALKLVFALVWVFYAYTGWNGASYIAGEIGNPGRRLPRAILLGTGLVVVLYLGLNLVYALALPVADVQALAARSGHDAVKPIAELAARRLLGSAWSGRFSCAIGIILLAALSAFLLTGPRVAFAMARAGQLPAIIGRTWGSAHTPVGATTLLTVIALLLLWTGSFDGIVLFSEIGLALLSLATISAVYVLRRTRPELPRPFRVPGYPFVPALYLVVTSGLIAAAFIESPGVSALALVTILAGLPVYELAVRRRRRMGQTLH